MLDRKRKIEELLTDFQALRRAMALKSTKSASLPRVTPSQWGVLTLIEQREKSTVKEISQALGVTSSAATQLVEGLVTSGYLVRKTSAEDRRNVILTLSKKSKKHIDGMKKHALQRFLKIFEALTDKEFEQYFALNKKIVQRSLSKSKRNI